MLIEETIPQLLKQKFKLFDINGLEMDFVKLYQNFFSDNIKLIPKYGLELEIVKIGYLNLTFTREANYANKYLRIFMEADNAGIKFFENHPEIDFDYFVTNWKTTYYQLQKPIEFTIIDACYTNSEYVWDEKYFYG